MGSGRTKIETPDQFAQAYKVITDLKLDAMVIVGGDDSNTNAALLAEFFKSKGSDVTFVGVPKILIISTSWSLGVLPGKSGLPKTSSEITHPIDQTSIWLS